MKKEEIVITSVVEFVQEISKLRKSSISFNDGSGSSLTFFRGQANSEWGLSPRLYREGLLKKERSMISEFIRIMPEEFNNLAQFDILVKMQHYGLPTRLLDATLNPLIALFFACHEERFKNLAGTVFGFRNLPVLREEMSTIKTVLKFIFEYSGPPLKIEKFLNDLQISKTLMDFEPIRNDLKNYLSILTIPIQAVLPKFNNPRIIKQDGAFFLFGMKSFPYVNPNRKESIPDYLDFSPIEFDSNEELKNFWPNSIVFQIPPESKELILEDLESLGITENKMFPELEYQADYITQQMKKDIIRSSTSSITKPAQS
jgi:hypothetical protein